VINPKEILAASQQAQQFGASASTSMSQPFMDAVPTMSIASGSNASQMMGGVHDVGSQMLDQFKNVKASIDQQLFTHQDEQRRAKSYDFKPDIADLRPTEAQGFPKELAGEFFQPFLHK